MGNKNIEEEEQIVGDVANHQKRGRKRSEFEAVNPEQHKKKDELQISPTIWNNRKLDVLIKELCDIAGGISTV